MNTRELEDFCCSAGLLIVKNESFTFVMGIFIHKSS